MATESQMQEYNPNRKWQSVSGPAQAGDSRIVFYSAETDEYAEVAAQWRNGGFSLFGNAFGRGIEYYTHTAPDGTEIKYERYNGKSYAPAEFH